MGANQSAAQDKYTDDDGSMSTRIPVTKGPYQGVPLLFSRPQDVSNPSTPTATPVGSPSPRPPMTPPAQRLAMMHGDQRRVVCYLCGNLVPLSAYAAHESECENAEIVIRAALPESLRSRGGAPRRPDCPLPGGQDSSVEFLAYNAEAKHYYKKSLFSCPTCSEMFPTDEIADHARRCSHSSPKANQSNPTALPDPDPTIYCYLCGQRTPATTAATHRVKCRSITSATREKLGLPVPNPPPTALPTPHDAASGKTSYTVYNTEARTIYMRSLPKCPKCLKTVTLSDFGDHCGSCRGAHPQDAGVVSL